MWHIIIPYGIYLKCAGIGVPGFFHFGVEIPAWMAYNMLNKVADTIVHTYPFPAKILVKIAPLLCQSGGAIFYVQHSPKWQQ